MENAVASIVIPCYNHAEYLAECLESVRAQTVANWEAIVVDDASTEGDVRGVVESLHDQRVRCIFHEQNRGLAAARNTGVRHASSQIIVPLDADDRLSPKYLELVVESLSDLSISFAYFYVQCFGISSSVWRSKPFDPAAVAREHQFILGTAPFRKEVWNQCGGWCEEAVFKLGYEDTDFLMSMVGRGFRGIHIPQPFYQYRRTRSSLSIRPRTYVLPIYRRIYERNKEFILRYSSYSDWMALGWLEVAEANLRLMRPFRSLGCGLSVWITSKRRRPEGAEAMISSIRLLRNRAASNIKTNLLTGKKPAGKKEHV